jgi:hypothetical protein
MSSLEKQKICKLLFFVDQDFEDSLIDEVEELIDKLASSRGWLLGPPAFVNEEDEDGNYILGGLFRLYSAFNPEKLDPDVDWAHLDEAKEIVRHVQRFSAEKKITFTFELDQEEIGEIKDGKLDEGLEVVYLQEWEKALQEDEGHH